MEFRLIIQLHLKSVLCLTTSLDGKTLYASFVKIKKRRSLFSSRLINFHAVLQTTVQKTEAPEKNMDQDHVKDSLIMLPVHKIYHSITRKLLSQSIGKTLPKHTSLIKMLLSVQSRSAICWMEAVNLHKPVEPLCLSQHHIKYQCSRMLKKDSIYQFASNVKISTKKSELRLISFKHLLQPLLLNLQVKSDKI